MNAKDLLGKKIIDSKARDLAKLAEIELNVKTFTISKIYGSIGNPLSKKYYDIKSDSILTVGDYIQVKSTTEDLESSVLDNIPETEEGCAKINDLIGKTVLDCEGNIAGKISNIELDLDSYEITAFKITKQSSSFVKPKVENIVSKQDITSIGDYIIINKVFKNEEEKVEEKEKEKETEESKESVNVNID